MSVAVIEDEIADGETRSGLRELRRRSAGIAVGLALSAALLAAAFAPLLGGGGDDAPRPAPRTGPAPAPGPRPEAEEAVPGRAEPGTITIPNYDPVP